MSWESDVTPSFPTARWEIATFHIYPLQGKGSVTGKSRVIRDEVSNPFYHEYIRYISPFLCLRGQKLQQQHIGRVDFHNPWQHFG